MITKKVICENIKEMRQFQAHLAQYKAKRSCKNFSQHREESLKNAHLQFPRLHVC